MEGFKNRLKMFVESYLGMSKRAFEIECNLSIGTLSSIKVKGPTVEVVMKISSVHPELNLNWLISGRGEMILGEEEMKECVMPGKSESEVPATYDIHHNQNVSIEVMRDEMRFLHGLVMLLRSEKQDLVKMLNDKK